MRTRPRDSQGRIVTVLSTGRRHCRCCKRWRHSVDFGVRVWCDKTRTEPKYLQSECRTCRTRNQKALEQRRNAHAREARKKYEREYKRKARARHRLERGDEDVVFVKVSANIAMYVSTQYRMWLESGRVGMDPLEAMEPSMECKHGNLKYDKGRPPECKCW